jgi:hypothetical protein
MYLSFTGSPPTPESLDDWLHIHDCRIQALADAAAMLAMPFFTTFRPQEAVAGLRDKSESIHRLVCNSLENAVEHQANSGASSGYFRVRIEWPCDEQPELLIGVDLELAEAQWTPLGKE